MNPIPITISTANPTYSETSFVTEFKYILTVEGDV